MQNTRSSRPIHSSHSWRASALVGVLVATGAATVVGAAVDAPRRTVSLWTGDDQWIKIEPQDDAAAPPNDQPATLDQTTVANALGTLRVSIADPDTGTSVQKAVFTREEIANLAPYVTSGLAKAGPRQDVTFSTIGSRSRGAGSTIKDPSVNAGRVFYQGGKLNVIFGELQSNYRKKLIYGQRDQDFTPRRVGTREKVSDQKVAFAVTPGAGTVRSDWLAIDLAVAGSQPVTATAATQSAPAASAAPAASGTPPASQPAAAQSASPAAAHPAPPPAPPVVAPVPSSAGAPAATDKTTDLEHRLRALKDMKDKGLITEEAYQAKMKELLSEL